MKNFCEKQLQHGSGKLPLLMCGASLFITPFALLTKG
jgi:hypothetical protein